MNISELKLDEVFEEYYKRIYPEGTSEGQKRDVYQAYISGAFWSTTKSLSILNAQVQEQGKAETLDAHYADVVDTSFAYYRKVKDSA